MSGLYVQVLYFARASPSSTAVADVTEVCLFVRNKMIIKALKKRTMFSFKEVCFVAGGVIFIFFFFLIRYVIHTVSTFYHTQFRKLNKNVTTLNNDVKNWTVMMTFVSCQC